MGNPDPPKTTRPVFISYANEDQVVADGVRAALEEGGVLCWIAPRDVKGGRPYSGQITQAIREAQVLLLILSAASNRSKHVLREVERAAHCQNHLLTFRIGRLVQLMTWLISWARNIGWTDSGPYPRHSTFPRCSKIWVASFARWKDPQSPRVNLTRQRSKRSEDSKSSGTRMALFFGSGKVEWVSPTRPEIPF